MIVLIAKLRLMAYTGVNIVDIYCMLLKLIEATIAASIFHLLFLICILMYAEDSSA